MIKKAREENIYMSCVAPNEIIEYKMSLDYKSAEKPNMLKPLSEIFSDLSFKNNYSEEPFERLHLPIIGIGSVEVDGRMNDLNLIQVNMAGDMFNQHVFESGRGESEGSLVRWRNHWKEYFDMDFSCKSILNKDGDVDENADLNVKDKGVEIEGERKKNRQLETTLNVIALNKKRTLDEKHSVEKMAEIREEVIEKCDKLVGENPFAKHLWSCWKKNDFKSKVKTNNSIYISQTQNYTDSKFFLNFLDLN